MPRIHCRQVNVSDLPTIANLLQEGFPERALSYWQAGLLHMAAYDPPDVVPRFGYLLEADDVVVGVLLLVSHSDADGIRANVSNWYVRPAYRTYASLLVLRVIRNKSATYFNITPGKLTLPIIEAQGFIRATAGCFFGESAFSVPRSNAVINWVSSNQPRSNLMPATDAELLVDHARFGCVSLWLQADGEGYPFIFRKRVLRTGRLPCAVLIYCRSLEELEKFATPIGRALAMRGMPFLLACSDRPLRGIMGRHFPTKFPIYYKGNLKPRSSDLSYTETAVFGP
jgi:hypothetical protein